MNCTQTLQLCDIMTALLLAADHISENPLVELLCDITDRDAFTTEFPDSSGFALMRSQMHGTVALS